MSIKPLLRPLLEEFCLTIHHRLPTSLAGRRTRREGEHLITGIDAQWASRDLKSMLPGAVEVPTSLAPVPGIQNPALRKGDVTDFGEADFVADPFLVLEDKTLHLFFEVLNAERDPNSAIGHAISEDGGQTWTYSGVVLKTNVHISFPYTFQHEGQYYMLPEQDHPDQQRVDLFVATEFPDEWTYERTLLSPDHRVQDNIVFRWQNRWWLLIGSGYFDTTYAYYSGSLRGPWQPHRSNPIIANREQAAKPAGRPLVFEDRLVIFFQDCREEYGHRVRAYDTKTLTPHRYEDTEIAASPVLEGTGGIGWNAGRMHHIDPLYLGDGKWLFAVDGDVGFPRRLGSQGYWSVGLYGSDL